MAFTPDKLKTARDSGYTDDEIWDFLGKDDQRFNLAKENGYSLDETITTFSKVEPEPDQPFFALEDAVSAIGTIPEALSVGVPAAFQKLVTGTAMPEESEAMEKDIAFQERMRQEQQDRQAAGKSSMVGEAIREAAPSIATSFGGLGAGIAGAVGGTVVGGPVGATVGGMAASGTASYRMAAADLLYRSFKALEEQKGSPLTEEEKAQAYKEFLPLAQNSALWEAGPEAVSNAVLLGAGKFVFGFGKPLARKLVGESIERVNKGIASKVAAGTGVVAAELGTETITALGQFAPEMAAQKYVRTGTTEGAPTEYPGGAMQAFKDVAPATLALTGMMAGAGGVAKAATLPFQKAKTPEQIEEDNINLDAEREADNLLIPDNDTESKSIKSQIDTERADLAIKKELYNTLPDGDKTKAVLATEIKEYEGRITELDNTLRQRLGLSLPITTAEQQQIELARAITAPAEAAPTTKPKAKIPPPPPAIITDSTTSEQIASEISTRKSALNAYDFGTEDNNKLEAEINKLEAELQSRKVTPAPPTAEAPAITPAPAPATISTPPNIAPTDWESAIRSAPRVPMFPGDAQRRQTVSAIPILKQANATPGMAVVAINGRTGTVTDQRDSMGLVVQMDDGTTERMNAFTTFHLQSDVVPFLKAPQQSASQQTPSTSSTQTKPQPTRVVLSQVVVGDTIQLGGSPRLVTSVSNEKGITTIVATNPETGTQQTLSGSDRMLEVEVVSRAQTQSNLPPAITPAPAPVTTPAPAAEVAPSPAVMEQIAATAVIDKDGKILSSPSKTHAQIMEETKFNLDAGEFPPTQNFGFVTTTGRFVQQKEAQQIAQKAKQVQGNQPISGEIVSGLQRQGMLPTPAAPAAEVAPIQRDMTKPEQMTPEEWNAAQLAPLKKPSKQAMSKAVKYISDAIERAQASWDLDRRTGTVNPKLPYPISTSLRIIRQNAQLSGKENKAYNKEVDLASALSEIQNAGDMAFEFVGGDPIAFFATKTGADIEVIRAYFNQKDEYTQDTEQQRQAIDRAFQDATPVSAAAVEAYGIKLPAGYTKQGDLYVYQPTPAETPAAPAVEPLTDDQAETIRDVITLRKSQGREPNPEQVKRLAEYDARKAGVDVQEGDIVSNIVVGHPMFEAPQPELSNLVPIKVQNKEQLASSIQRTQQVRDAAQSYIGQYQVEQAKAKTPAQKKAFAKKFNKSELDRQRDILDYIKNDVMPELDRLEKSAPSATPAAPAAEVAPAPAVAENAPQRLIRSATESGLKPIKPREVGALRGFYTFQAKDSGSKIAFSSGATIAEESPNELNIEAIYTPPKERGTGSASRLLNEILSIADKNNITLKLEPKGISDLAQEGDVFLTKKQLASWYKRYGFQQETEGSDDILVRTPAVSEAPAAEPAGISEEVTPVVEPVVKISRSEDFSMSGDYNVSIGDKKHRIYRDSESGYWYDADVRDNAVKNNNPAQGSPSLGLLSTETRKDAIAELVNKYKKEQLSPVAETPAAPAAEPAGISVGNRVKQLEAEYNAAKAKLDALGDEPRKPSSEAKFFGSNGRKAASPELVAKYDADVKAYNTYRRKYLAAKKAEVEASNKLFYARRGEAGGVLIPTKQDFIDAGQNIYEAGMEFGAWAKQMIQRFGDAVRQFLADVWEAVSGFPAKLEEMAGYLPGKGERGAVTFGRGEEPKKPAEPAPEKPAEEKPAMDRYKGKAQVAGVRGIGAEKDTPKGINKKTEAIIRDRVFDATIVNDNQTKKAWNLIQKIEDKNPDAGKNAQAINELTRETMQDVEADEVVKQSIGAVKLRNELYAYAIKLAGEGDPKMLNYLLNTRLSIGSGSIVEGDAGRLLQAMASLKSWIVRATEAEQQGFFEIAAQQFFGTKTPTDEQVQQIKNIFNKVKEVKIDQEKELMTELEEVGKAAGVDLPSVVEKQLENTPGLDPMVVAITNMLKMGGTFTYRPTKNKIGEAVRNTISRGITNYRKKIVSKAATGLETGFWKTLSSTEDKPGPLGELDSAQNRALGNIVKQTLVKMGLKGTPPDTKMSIYEQVASILGEQPLSQDKIKMADEKIRGGIEAKREAELENASEDQKAAINLKYDGMIIAWDDAMSRSLDMPVSDTMLRRMILNELKEADTSIQDIATLMDEEPVIGTSRQDRLINSIIEKVTGITFEGQLTRDYTNLKSYLSSLLENMVIARQQKNKAAKAVAKTKRDASGDPDKQAQAQIDKLAKIQADPTIFGEKKIDPVRNAVRDALSLQLNIGFTPEQSAKIKAGWKGAFVADPNKKGIPTSFMLELQRLGVSEAAANTLADIVWRQIEVNAMSRQIDATTKAVEAGPIGGIVQAILDTPLANQQDPNWRKNVILDYLKNAGVKPSQAENIAKLFDVSLRKRFAKAQEEAAIKAAKSIEGGLNTNSKRALEKFLKAIRAQVLDPGKDVAKAFAEEMGWKGFTSEQIVRLNELDAIVNDNEKTDAEIAVALEQIQKIIDKVSMPPQIKEVLASFYIGNALMRFPTFAVQVFDPLAMATFNAAIESFRNITNPQQFIQTWVNYGRAISNLARETAFSYKNDVLRSGRMIDYLDNQDRKIKRLADESVRKFKAGDIRGAMKDGIIGYTAWTFRTLKALDDGAYSLLTSTTLPQYVEAALKNAKIPREKRRGVMRQVLEAREMDIRRMVAEGVSKNDAVVYANERMQAAITKELSGLNINAQEVINSAINDALARIGKTRFAEDILTGKVEEIKDLGTISAPFLRWYESVSKSVSGSGSESQKIFYRILLGFPLIPARIFNIAAGYTPLTIYRHALKNRYSLTYGTALQRRQRLAEQLAGTMILLPLLALRSNSTDEEDEKEKGFGVYITGQGPSRMKDKTLHAKWNDRHDPFSLEFRMGGKTKFSIDAKAAGPLSVMIYLLGAMDDWETNRKLDGLKTSKDDWKEAQDNASIFTSLYDLAGYAVLTTARRGPTTGVMQGLVDFRRFPDDPIAAIGADVAFSAMPAVPILGTGIAKNLSDFFSQPIDNTTKEGAILSNIPIVGPIAGKPALNSYGQRLGELRVSEKLKKSFGVPFTLVVSDSEEDNKLTSLTLKFGDGPTPLRREDVENELKSAISDEEWYLAAKTFGDRNRSYVLKNYNRYEKMKPVGFSKVMSALGKASKANAIAAVKKARRNNT